VKRVAKKLTPQVQRVLVSALSGGATKKAAAHAAGISDTTLADWLALAETGHPRLARFARAIAVARARPLKERDSALARALGERRTLELLRESELADGAAQLVDAGATLRGAATALGIPWTALRVLLKRGRRGEAHLTALARSAQRRARAPRRPRTCPHCGGELGTPRSVAPLSVAEGRAA